MSTDFVLVFNMVLLSFLIFSTGFIHVLKVLLSLELVVINVFIVIVCFSISDSSYYLGLYFLIFSVCESILGLSLVVLMVRYYGNDYVKSMTLSVFI